MAFRIAVPSSKDLTDVASTHLAAMDPNLLMHAQFPNDEARQFLREELCRDTLAHSVRNNMGVLVARDVTTGKIASFIKWNVQRPSGDGDSNGDGSKEPDEQIPDCCRREYLDSYAELCKQARHRVLGSQSHYRAATALLQTVQDRAGAEGFSVVLEATMNAVTFYQKLGFDIRLDLEMMLPPRGSSEPTEHYSERTMVWNPPTALVAMP
ncbi:hypothetical protein BGZ63DRAFT_345941 [Mariannaea sp. PMI_226]|nr:hypothetical protein BGZ63DRAFT_345941 [Mariannaea sp. PMI_226]